MLRELAKHFELILFTSSSKLYCEALINNVIETEDCFFDHKLYKRQCKILPGQSGCLKDLDMLLKGRSIKDILIVDNRSSNYRQHILNGIPIIDFTGDTNEDALLHLQ